MTAAFVLEDENKVRVMNMAYRELYGSQFMVDGGGLACEGRQTVTCVGPTERTPADQRADLRLQAAFLHKQLSEHLPHYATPYLTAALAGDLEAAGMLPVSAPNELRGYCAVLIYLTGSVAALQAILEPVWGHDHRSLIEAARNAHRLRAMFRRADYALPNTIPETARVYRGTSALSAKAAARGHAWTTDRDVACWFAMRFAEQNGRPLVLSADVARSMISTFTDERSEREAVIFGGVPWATLDGDLTNWTRRAAVVTVALRQRHA